MLGTLHYWYAFDLMKTCGPLGIALPQGAASGPVHALLVGLHGTRIGHKAWRTVFPNAEIVLISFESLQMLLQAAAVSMPPSVVAVVPSTREPGPVALAVSLVDELKLDPERKAVAAWIFFPEDRQPDALIRSVPCSTTTVRAGTLMPEHLMIDLGGILWHVRMYSGEIRGLAQVYSPLSRAPVPIDCITWKRIFPTALHIMLITAGEYASACERCVLHFPCSTIEEFQFSSSETQAREGFPSPVRYISRRHQPALPNSTSLLKFVLTRCAFRTKPEILSEDSSSASASGSESLAESDSESARDSD